MEFEVKWVYIVVSPHCSFNELQKQNKMEDSDYTNFPVHMLKKNQTTTKSTKEFYFSKYRTKEKSFVSFNSKGYDMDTLIELQLFLLRTF